MSRTYAHELEWVDVVEVRVGDRIACLLSDAEAYLVVTGWSDRELLVGTSLACTHRTFTVKSAPWWARDMLTADHASQELIVKRTEEN